MFSHLFFTSLLHFHHIIIYLFFLFLCLRFSDLRSPCYGVKTYISINIMVKYLSSKSNPLLHVTVKISWLLFDCYVYILDLTTKFMLWTFFNLYWSIIYFVKLFVYNFYLLDFVYGSDMDWQTHTRLFVGSKQKVWKHKKPWTERSTSQI